MSFGDRRGSLGHRVFARDVQLDTLDAVVTVYSSEMHGQNLDVFCVSNKWYEKYCRKGNTMFVEASGVPDVRRFCHTVTADAQLNEAKHFLKSRMSAMLNTLNLWADSSLQKQEKEKLDDSIRTKAKELIDEVRSSHSSPVEVLMNRRYLS